jgi:hypothetical protein
LTSTSSASPPWCSAPTDYEAHDRALVTQAAAGLSALTGEYDTEMFGNAVFFKLDWNLTPRHYLSSKLNLSRYRGKNNVFFDPASPITHSAISENGEEQVNTETGSISLVSAFAPSLTSNLRLQFSHDRQASLANTDDPRVKIADLLDGMGRSSILPRQTREHRLHIAETLVLQGRRHELKFGADLGLTWIYNYFPLMYGGQYIFDNMRVNPFTFAPATYGLRITPLRAYAHEVPRYYIQDFGSAVSHPDTSEFAFFVQDTLRVSNRLAISLGLRYDRQNFRDDMEASSAWPLAGQTPRDNDNIAPRIGLAYVLGDDKPLVIRAGYGVFYTRIPSIYTSALENYNGLNRTHLFLDNMQALDRHVFPSYPAPLVYCPPGVTACPIPEPLKGRVTTEIASFSQDFKTPSVQQASANIEKDLGWRLAAGASYLWVRGQNLIRARDANLPDPVELTYPVFDQDGDFLNQYYSVHSFSTWQFIASASCPFPPCLNDVERPIPEVGAINVFETAARSSYHGLTLSLRKRMSSGIFFRVGYTWAKALDSGQDALVAGRPALVQDSSDPAAEWGPSVTDQRQRFIAAWSWYPKPFHRDRPALQTVFNDWGISGVITAGTGRPVNARVLGDANRDGNDLNDRLPGVSRNSALGPDYASFDMRLTRRLRISERYRLEALVEIFNVMNRANKRVDVSDDGFTATAGSFSPGDRTVAGRTYPGYFVRSSSFAQPNNAYAPRQLQFSLRLRF